MEMFKRKCPSCARKIKKDFSYCPYCGASRRGFGVSDNDFGMLGRNDSGERVQSALNGHDSGEPELKLPFGLNGIMNSLIKQLESQLGNMDLGDGQGMPRGVKIRVARGPQMNQVVRRVPEKKVEIPKVSDEENERRASLPKVEVESKIKRLGNTIIYEIETPGVKIKGDVVLTELATGLEIKAYSKNKCYVKFIPLKVEVIQYSVEKEKVVVEIRG